MLKALQTNMLFSILGGPLDHSPISHVNDLRNVPMSIAFRKQMTVLSNKREKVNSANVGLYGVYCLRNAFISFHISLVVNADEKRGQCL